MRIGILTISYHPEYLGIGRIAGDLSVALARQGHEVDVITAMPHYPEFRIHPEYRGALLKTEHPGIRVRVRRSYLFVRKGATFLAKAGWYASFTITSIINAIRTETPDVILVFSPPPTLTLTALAWRRFSRIPIVLDLQDIVPDAAIAYGLMTNPLQIRFFRALERLAYSISEQIVVVAPNFVDNLRRKSVPPEKVTVILNWVDTEAIRPLPRDGAYRHRQGVRPSQFVVMYAGNVGLSQGLEVVLDAAKQMSEERDLLFLLVGDGTTKEALLQRAQSEGLHNIRFLPSDEPDMAELQAAADVSLVIQKANVLDVNLPSKIPVIMASGRPIVAALNRENDAAAIARESGAAILVEPGRPDQLAAAIRRLHRSPELRARLAANGRRYAVEHFSLEAAVRAYEACLGKVAGNRSGLATTTAQKP